MELKMKSDIDPAKRNFIEITEQFYGEQTSGEANPILDDARSELEQLSIGLLRKIADEFCQVHPALMQSLEPEQQSDR